MSRTLLTCGLVLIFVLTGCGVAEPSSEEVAEVVKRLSGGMEGLRPEFWAPTELLVALDDPIATGDAVQIRLSDLQVQTQQPPGEPALRLVGQMHLRSQLTQDAPPMMLLNYATSFLNSGGEMLPGAEDSVQPLLEQIAPGQELTVEFKAPIPGIGDDVQQIGPEPRIAGLEIEIAYSVGDASDEEALTFSLTLEAE